MVLKKEDVLRGRDKGKPANPGLHVKMVSVLSVLCVLSMKGS